MGTVSDPAKMQVVAEKGKLEEDGTLTIRTTLYELFAILHDVMGPVKDELVVGWTKRSKQLLAVPLLRRSTVLSGEIPHKAADKIYARLYLPTR